MLDRGTTWRGFVATPKKPDRPWLNVLLISLNGQLAGDGLQSVKSNLESALVSSEALNGLMVQRNLVSHLASPLLSQLSNLNGESSQHTGVSWSALVTSSSLVLHSAHSPVGLV